MRGLFPPPVLQEERRIDMFVGRATVMLLHARIRDSAGTQRPQAQEFAWFKASGMLD